MRESLMPGDGEEGEFRRAQPEWGQRGPRALSALSLFRSNVGFWGTELLVALRFPFPVSCQASACHPVVWVRASHHFGRGRLRVLSSAHTLEISGSVSTLATPRLVPQVWVNWGAWWGPTPLTLQPGKEPLFCRKYCTIDQSACRQKQRGENKYYRDVSSSWLIQIRCYFLGFCDIHNWFLFEICNLWFYFLIVHKHSLLHLILFSFLKDGLPGFYELYAPKHLGSASCLRASLVSQLIKNLPVMQETWVWSLGWEDHLEKERATHPSILAWRIPWTV